MNYKLFLPLALLLLVSCGQKQQAKSTVKDFVKANIAADDYSFKDFGKLDSTRYVTDSIIGVMKTRVADDNTFRKEATYGMRTGKEQLKYLPVKMKVADKDTTFTFYLTNDLTKVVAVK
jgi:hypothetical protein